MSGILRRVLFFSRKIDSALPQNAIKFFALLGPIPGINVSAKAACISESSFDIPQRKKATQKKMAVE